MTLSLRVILPVTFTPLPVGAVRAEGWMQARLERDAAGLVGHLDELCDEVTLDIYDVARVSDERPGGWWNGESTGNWLDGLVRLAAALPDNGPTALRDKVETCVDRILASQDDDGYLGVYPPQRRWQTSGPSGELFCQSRLLSILLAHHDATGRAEILDAAVRAAALIVDNVHPGRGNHYFSSTGRVDGGRAHGLLIAEQMLDLAARTGDARFGDFAVSCYLDYSTSGIESPVEWCYADCKLPHLLDEDRPFIGHGPHTAEHLRLPLMLHHRTGDAGLRAAFAAGYRKLLASTGLSGACKSDEWIGMRGLDGAAVAPVPEAGYEYCTSTELSMTLVAAAGLTGDGQYADAAEWLAFNAAEAARRSDGRSIAYVAADNQYNAEARAGARWKYSPTHGDVAVCCAPNAGRLLPHYVSRMVMASADGGLAVVLMGPSRTSTRVGGVGVVLVQRTDYPFGDEVAIEVEVDGDAAFPLWIRVPRWATSSSVTLDGGPVDSERRGDFVRIERTWTGRTTMVVRLEADPRVVAAVDGTKAMARGALLFALPISESVSPTRSYAVEGFVDLDIVPDTDARWNFTLLLDSAGNVDATMRTGSMTDEPWAQPPVTLSVPAIDPQGDVHFGATVTHLELVPIGSTTLRRTSFPAVASRSTIAAPPLASGDGDLAGT